MSAETRQARVLVPIDPMSVSESAVAPAIDVARRLGAAVTLLAVCVDAGSAPASLLSFIGGVPEAQRVATARQRLEELRVGLDADVPVDVDVIWDTSPAAGIRRYANDQAVDLIAVSTHGRRGLSRLVFGSVTEDLLRDSERPVLVVPIVRNPDDA